MTFGSQAVWKSTVRKVGLINDFVLKNNILEREDGLTPMALENPLSEYLGFRLLRIRNSSLSFCSGREST